MSVSRAMSHSRLDPQPGGSLLVAWQLNGKHVLIVGGGEIAAQRLLAIINADARVTLVAPSPLHPNILPLLPFVVAYHDRVFIPSDLDSFPSMVLTAISDPHESRIISAACRERRIPINVADDPPACDFYFGSVIRRGPLQILISTNGNGPKIASLMKKRVEDAIPENIAQVIANIADLRRRLRQRTIDIAGIGPSRMKWISQVCETWSFQDIALMNEEDITKLLDEGWEKGVVPHPIKNRKSHWKVLVSNMNRSDSALTFAIGFLSGILATAALKRILSTRS